MKAEENKFDFLRCQVFNIICAKSSKRKPVKAKELCYECNISLRDLKKIITDLRIDYPIVSKETDGGGYWMAESENDIIQFVEMIERRKKGYEKTIEIMNTHLVNYGNIPYID